MYRPLVVDDAFFVMDSWTAYIPLLKPCKEETYAKPAKSGGTGTGTTSCLCLTACLLVALLLLVPPGPGPPHALSPPD